MGAVAYLDTILVPFSLFLMLAYHAYLWHSFKNNPSQHTNGIHSLWRKVCYQHIKQGGENDDKKSMLLIQSLRNAQMTCIFTASTSILITMSLAALNNNSYKASHLLSGGVAYFGNQSGTLYAVKFGLASLFLLVSFLLSSMGLSFLIDSNFLMNTPREFSSTSSAHIETVLEKGILLALMGNRVLCISFPVLVWTFGPVPVALSSVGLVWGLYELDFSGNVTNHMLKT